MKSFEDSIPEEQEEKQKQLIALLRRAYSQEQTLPESEQQESIMRVEERLARMEKNTTSFVERTPEVAAGAFLSRSQSRSARERPVMRVVSALAAVLVVGVLIGSATLLFTRRAHSLTGTTSKSVLTRPTSVPNAVDVKWDGLEMSMNVTPGPYFLGELLAVNLSLTNHTHPMLTLGGKNSSEIYSCSPYALFPEQTGGTSPHYSLYTEPVPFLYSCLVPAPGPNSGPALTPGQTVTDHFYVLLTSSGDVTLTGTAFFYVLEQGWWQRNAGPLTGHLSALHIHVAPQAPADRMLSLQQEGSKVVIHAPTGIHLVDQTYILCQVSSTDRGTPGGYNYWQTLSTNTLQRPECPNISGWAYGHWATNQWTMVLWKYAIGAVGYAVVQGRSTDAATSHP